MPLLYGSHCARSAPSCQPLALTFLLLPTNGLLGMVLILTWALARWWRDGGAMLP